MNTYKHLLIGITLCSIFACKADTNERNIALTTTQVLKPIPDGNIIQVALLLDTSSSMDGLIDQAKAQLWEIVNELSYAECKHVKPKLQIAIYQYGNDGLSNKNGYIEQVIGFTSDLDDISEKLFSLTTNGGEEYCGTVINTAIKKLDWGKNKNDLKLIFIAGNEAFTQGSINYIDAVTDAKEKEISVNTIFCGGYENGVSGMWQDGALRANGDYITINHNQKTVHVPTPYDAVILQLNIKLNKTYIPYGTSGKKKVAKQQLQDKNAASYGTANEVSRIVNKSSKFYNNSSWDLVDAEILEDDYQNINKKTLPKALQQKTSKELKLYVEKQRETRNTLNDKIHHLNTKRKLFIKANKKENNNGLESAMLNAIKKQAKQKEYSWAK